MTGDSDLEMITKENTDRVGDVFFFFFERYRTGDVKA